MNDFVNKNDKQMFFNRVKGIICEKNKGDIFCSITLTVGHENTRTVNLSCKNANFLRYDTQFSIGDKVCVTFFITSTFVTNRWHTYANILEIHKDEYTKREPQL